MSVDIHLEICAVRIERTLTAIVLLENCAVCFRIDHDKERSEGPCVVTDELVEKVNDKIREIQCYRLIT